jgi:hypothetical protein
MGDPAQRPVKWKEASTLGQRLSAQPQQQAQAAPHVFFHFLSTQYVANPVIAQWANTTFYGGRLRTDETVKEALLSGNILISNRK